MSTVGPSRRPEEWPNLRPGGLLVGASAVVAGLALVIAGIGVVDAVGRRIGLAAVVVLCLAFLGAAVVLALLVGRSVWRVRRRPGFGPTGSAALALVTAGSLVGAAFMLVPIDNPVAPTALPQTCHPIDALDGSVTGVESAIDLAEVEGLTASDRAQLRAADRQYQRALDRRCQVVARQRADRAAISVGIAIALTLAVLVVSARRRRALPAPSATDKGFR